jgi:DNA polymerase
MPPNIIEMMKKRFNLDTILFLDWESFYKSKANNGTKSFSLKSKTYAAYLFDERFHTTGFGWARDDDELEYVHTPDEISALMDHFKARRESGERIGLVAHNTRFDGAICGWTHDLMFDAYFCTKDMSTLLASHLPASLAKAAQREWPEDESLHKGGAELAEIDGIQYHYITPRQHENLEKYCKQDTNLMRRLFVLFVERILEQGLSLELDIIDITLRGHLEPQFAINREMLFEVIDDEQEKKGRAVADAIQFCHSMDIMEVSPETFGSNPKYSALLERFGLIVPTKVSPANGKITEALGKGDPEYIKLQIANPAIAPVFKARMIVKSTIALTRARTMVEVADQFHAAGHTDADMPFFLNYYGARQTGRWSGGQKLNQQNNTRGGKHRLSMMAPEGKLIDVCDLSNIELRVNLWLCGQDNLLQNFANDPDYDLYSEIASDVFAVPINKKDNPDERQVGKAAALGLGFSMGWFGFQQYLASGPLGMEPMFKDDAFCRNVKQTYDIKHYGIRAMWMYLSDYVMPVIVNGGELHFGPGNQLTASKGQVRLPSGRTLQYANARTEMQENMGGFSSKVIFDSDKRNVWGHPVKKYLWHGLLLENLCQAIARDILAWQIVGIEDMLKTNKWGWVMGSVHDEVLSAVNEENAGEIHAEVTKIMSTGPDWVAGLPLANEGGYAKEYSK